MQQQQQAAQHGDHRRVGEHRDAVIAPIGQPWNIPRPPNQRDQTPGHGKEDYQTGLKYNLDIYNPVLPDGRYDDSVPEFLRGKSIWDANDLVLEKLKELGTLFHAQKFDHEYPHCWRCKKPVIFRATEQWFVKASGGELSPAQLTAALASPTDPAGRNYDETLEKSSLWRNAVKFSYQVEFHPEWGRNRLQGMAVPLRGRHSVPPFSGACVSRGTQSGEPLQTI